MKKFLTAIVAAMFLLMPVVNAEIQTYTGTGEYRMGDSDTPKSAERGAKEKALRDALERAGVYVGSYSEVEDAELVTDKIISRTGAVLKVLDTKIVWDGFLVRVTVQVEIDADDLNRRLQNIDEKVSPPPIDKPKPLETPEKISPPPAVDNVALSKQKFDEGFKLCLDGKFREAVPVLNEALKLNPNNGDAYRELGWAYTRLKDFDKALFNRNKAVELNPNDLYAREGIAIVHNERKEYDKAISVCNEGIKINPNFEPFYHTRGNSYKGLKKYRQAIADFNKAIEINPNDKWAYVGRAYTYEALGEHAKARADFAHARQLGWKG